MKYKTKGQDLVSLRTRAQQRVRVAKRGSRSLQTNNRDLEQRNKRRKMRDGHSFWSLRTPICVRRRRKIKI